VGSGTHAEETGRMMIGIERVLCTRNTCIDSYDVLAVIVNYNSKSFLRIEKKLLEGITKLSKFIKLKLLFIDNCSSDGSFKELMEYGKMLCLDMEAVRLTKNFGFTRAVNIAWQYAHRRWNFRYLMLINNDLVIIPRNVLRLLKYLEIDGVAGVQGTIMQASNPSLIDNAGFAIDIFGLTYPICRGYTFYCAEFCCPSFLSGALSIYKAEAIEKLGQPFNNRVECYYDDKYLGLMLWSRGYKLLHIPLIVAYHLGSASYADRNRFKSPQWFKGIVLADVALTVSLRDPRRYIVMLYYGVASMVLSLFTTSNYVKSFIAALKEAEILKQNINLTRNIFGLVPKFKYIVKFNRLEKGIKIVK